MKAEKNYRARDSNEQLSVLFGDFKRDFVRERMQETEVEEAGNSKWEWCFKASSNILQNLTVL